MMFQQPDLLPDPNQRISVLFLLIEMYRNQPIVKNPFAPLFLKMMDDGEKNVPEITKQEKMFLYQLITSPTLTREVGDISTLPRKVLELMKSLKTFLTFYLLTIR